MKASELLVTTSQQRGWCLEKVALVVRAVRTMSDEELEKALEEIVLKGAILSNFIPLPFTSYSENGKRLMAAWRRVQDKFPHSALIRDFVWKFWHPRQDHRDAVLDREILAGNGVDRGTPSAREAIGAAYQAAESLA